MTDIDPEKLVAGDKSGIDLSESRPSLKALLKQQEQQLAERPEDTDPVARARLLLDIAETLLGLQEKAASWTIAREVFDVFINAESWQDAIEACDVMFQCEQAESLVALGNGIWLAVTYPVPAHLTVAMLQHVIDETPDDSDGAAVAQYIGHGNFVVWSDDAYWDERFTNQLDSDDLVNGQRLPWFMAHNCLTGGFHLTTYNTVGENLLKRGGGGAIGIYSPSGL